jgi:hypothetical protein
MKFIQDFRFGSLGRCHKLGPTPLLCSFHPGDFDFPEDVSYKETSLTLSIDSRYVLADTRPRARAFVRSSLHVRYGEAAPICR